MQLKLLVYILIAMEI